MSVGVGLWNLRGTARRPSSRAALHARLTEDARLVEDLGFDALWLGEHRFWYDGWCPQPMVAGAAVAAATTRLRVGTSVHLAAQHDAERSALAARTFGDLFGDRLELGVGLGYRREEYDGLGLRFSDRVARLEGALDALRVASPGRVWGGGMAPAAIERAARRGLPILLPPGLAAGDVRRLVAVARDAARAAGTTVPAVGLIKDVWADHDDEAARSWFLPRLAAHYREYAIAWWSRGSDGRVDREHVTRQVDRALRAAIVGSPAAVAGALSAYVAAGVDTFVLQCHLEETAERFAAQVRLLATATLPLLRGAAA